MNQTSSLLSDKSLSLFNVLLELRQASGKEFLFLSRDLANGVDLLNTVRLVKHQNQQTETFRNGGNTYAELNVRSEEVNALVSIQRALDKSRCNDILLAVQATKQSVRKSSTSIRHRERSRTSAILGLHNLITTELNPMHQLLVLLTGNGLAIGRLGEERNDGGSRVTTDNSDGCLGRVGLNETGKEASGTDDVEGGDTKDAAGVKDTSFFEGGGDNGDGGVDGVGDDEDVGFW